MCNYKVECSVANTNDRIVLKAEAPDLTPSAMQEEVHRPEDCKLCVNFDLSHDHGEGLLPLDKEPAGQTLLVGCIFMGQHAIGGAQKGGNSSSQFFSHMSVLDLFPCCRHVGNSLP